MPATLIPVIADFVHALADDVHPEAALLRAVEDGRPHCGRIEALAEMVQPHHDAIVERLGFQLNRAVGSATVCVPHHVAGGFRGRQLELVDDFVRRWMRETGADLAHECARARQFREIARDVDFSAHQRQAPLLDPDRDAGQVVAKTLRPGKRDCLQANLLDELFRLQVTVPAHALREPLDSEQLALGVAGLGQAVGVEQEHIPRLHPHRHLLEDLALADAERQVLPLQQPARRGPGLIVDGRRMAAVDQLEAAFDEIEACVTQRDEALELDELSRHLGVRERHDILRLGEHARRRQRDEAAQRLQEMALGCRAEERRGNALAHDIADDDVEAGVAVVEEIVEVAVDPL